ncbi:hypothetical protein Psi02_12830 [Planotetraspora silvatica]|uniref:Uncharacterized protein n=1 Tax=Planotetraspora silvatica TaxID=234614 RepID=A0A8J3UFY7_9ACTN|nr:hypothetical protein Psi02_12830 [Planotetraspora silvatica]
MTPVAHHTGTRRPITGADSRTNDRPATGDARHVAGRPRHMALSWTPGALQHGSTTLTRNLEGR